jgi:hypothetical protein
MYLLFACRYTNTTSCFGTGPCTPGQKTSSYEHRSRRSYTFFCLSGSSVCMLRDTRFCNNNKKWLKIIIIILFPFLSHTGEIHNFAPREAPLCHGSDSNLWPHGLEAGALPLQLSCQIVVVHELSNSFAYFMNYARLLRVSWTAQWCNLVHKMRKIALRSTWTGQQVKSGPWPLFAVHEIRKPCWR